MNKRTSLSAAIALVLTINMPVVAATLATTDTLSASASNALRHDQQAAERLADRLQAINSLSAAFSQSTSDKSGTPKVEQGEMQLKRPNQFRWQVTRPFSQEIIASEGKLWMLDPDFLQVVIKNQADQTSPTAVQLLSGNASGFLQDYLVVGDDSGSDPTYRLRPKKVSDLFEQLEIHFKQDQLSAITIFDALGGERRIEFTQVKVNQPITNQLFVPDLKKLEQAGYDIIDESNLNERRR